MSGSRAKANRKQEHQEQESFRRSQVPARVIKEPFESTVNTTSICMTIDEFRQTYVCERNGPWQRDSQGHSLQTSVGILKSIMNHVPIDYFAFIDYPIIHPERGIGAFDGSHRLNLIENFMTGQDGAPKWFNKNYKKTGRWESFSMLSEKNRKIFLSYPFIEGRIWHGISPAQVGIYFRRLNSGLSVNDEEELNSYYGHELHSIARVWFRGPEASKVSDTKGWKLLERLDLCKKHPLVDMWKLTETRHKGDTAIIKMVAMVFKWYGPDEQTNYEYGHNMNFYKNLYRHPSEDGQGGLWDNFADNNPKGRDDCVIQAWKFMEQLIPFLEQHPNGPKAFGDLHAFEGLYNFLRCEQHLMTTTGGKRLRTLGSLFPDPGKFAENFVNTHNSLKKYKDKKKCIKSDYGHIATGQTAREWEQKHDMIVDELEDTIGSRANWPIKPKTNPVRRISPEDKQILFTQQDHLCAYCEKKMTMKQAVGHHVGLPHTRGGSEFELVHSGCHDEIHGF